jgi:hypothetical protein
MAIATGTAILAGAALTAAGSAGNMIKGAKRAKDAQKALNNFKRQELKNVTEGMRVSTLGAELQTQEAQRRFATSVDALRSGGVRGLVGGLGQQEQLQQSQQQQIGAGLDQQQVAIDQMAAQDEQRIRQMQEQRESAAIAGLGSEIAAGKAQQQQGIAGIAEAGMSVLTAGMNGQLGGASVPGAEAITSAGNSAMSAGNSALASLSAPMTANLAQGKASSFQVPSSFNATNPYAIQNPNQYSVPKQDFSGLNFKF